MSEAMFAFMAGVTMLSAGIALVATFFAVHAARKSSVYARKVRVRPQPAMARSMALRAARPELFDIQRAS